MLRNHGYGKKDLMPYEKALTMDADAAVFPDRYISWFAKLAKEATSVWIARYGCNTYWTRDFFEKQCEDFQHLRLIFHV